MGVSDCSVHNNCSADNNPLSFIYNDPFYFPCNNSILPFHAAVTCTL